MLQSSIDVALSFATLSLNDVRTASISVPVWYCIGALVFLLYFFQLHHIVKIYLLQKPNSYIWTRGPGFLGQWFTSVLDHFVASGHIKQAFAEAGGKPFTIPGIGKYKTYVTNPKQLSEIESAHPNHLSFNPIVEQQLATHIIFHGFKFDPKDPRHTIPIHSLQILFKKNVHSVLPSLRNEVGLAFERELGSLDGKSDWVKKQPFTLSQGMFERVTNVLMVGKELADDPVFWQKSSSFIRNSRFAQEILRWTPYVVGEVVGRIIINWDGSKTYIYNRIMEVLWERLANGAESDEKPLDMLQWMLDSTRKKTHQMIERLGQHTMLFFFAGANAPPMLLSFALMNLCKYPEYLAPLREEIDRVAHEPETEEKYDSMVLMDSFLKETGRLQPLLSFTMARKVLKPFTFADGTHVPKDNWICAPQQVMNLDETNYSSPTTFNPFRFVPSQTASAEEIHEAKFTTPSHNYLYWSGPKRACTGRFFVSVTTKMILAEFITNYDFKLENPDLPHEFAWNHILLPHPLTKLFIRKKAKL